MAVIVSDGAITAIRGVASGAPAWQPPVTEPLWTRGAHAHLYRSIPAVRTAVDLFARNTGQIGLHLYQLLPDNDRIRDRTSGPARLIDRPNPAYSRYDLMYRLTLSLVINGETYIYKQGPEGARTALWYVSPRQLQVLATGQGPPAAYGWDLDPRRPIAASNFIRIWIPDPDDDWRPCPLLETLRQTIAGEQARERHQANLWRNGARWQGVIERPAAAPRWSGEQRSAFRTQLEQGFAGANAAGRIPVLEDGMTYKETSWSPAETQSHETFKAHRDEITRTHQIPLTAAGILDHATFSNVRELHKNLYQDALGPLLAQIEGAFRLQLLDEYGLFDSHYAEFNVNEKLQGAFEESVEAFAKAVDGPWITPNEARARNNLPRVMGGDHLYPQRGSGTGQPPRPPTEDAEPMTATVN